MEPTSSSIQHSAGGSYSADVRLRLHVNGTVFRLAQLAPDEVVLKEATALPEGDAVMVAVIDGHEQKWAVRIDEAVRAASRVSPVRVVPIEIERML